jgi:DNA repair exonuclease SbcCD nuclease subunit
VVVAGDVYDRDVPPTEAVTLFRSTVRGLVESGIKVAAIAGNHDSAERLSAYDGLTERSGVLVRGGFTSADAPGRCKRRQPLTRHLHNRVARRSVAPTLRACLVRVSTCSG